MYVIQNKIVRAITRIIIAVILGLFVISVESIMRMGQQIFFGPTMSNVWLAESTVFAGSVLTSIIIIAALSLGKMSFYGFRKPDTFRLTRMILLSFGIGLFASIIQMLLPGKGLTFVEDFTFIQIVVFIWIGRSIAEEIIFRGLIQSFLLPLVGYRFSIFGIHLTLPVMVGAICFALIHLMLLAIGIDGFTVTGIVVFAFVVGIIAGYYRESSGSLLPAVIIHSIFNISGSLIGLLF